MISPVCTVLEAKSQSHDFPSMYSTRDQTNMEARGVGIIHVHTFYLYNYSGIGHICMDMNVIRMYVCGCVIHPQRAPHLEHTAATTQQTKFIIKHFCPNFLSLGFSLI